MQQTNNICDACGEERATTWSEKYRAWLCIDHYRHPNTDDMIFARAVTTKPIHITCSIYGCTKMARIKDGRDGAYYCDEHNPFALPQGTQAVIQDDPVSHPKHYTSHPSGIECIQITRHMNFNIGNAIKYIWRAEEKGDIIQDYEKAIWYLKDEIERIKNVS